jgi:hypothetical protein
LAATSLSSDNPAALVALALIELFLAEPTNALSQGKLDELIDKWVQTQKGNDPVVVDRLTAQLRVTLVLSDAPAGPVKQAS